MKIAPVVIHDAEDEDCLEVTYDPSDNTLWLSMESPTEVSDTSLLELNEAGARQLLAALKAYLGEPHA